MFEKVNTDYPDKIEQILTFTASKKQNPERLDTYLTSHVTNASRNKVQQAISEGNVTLNGKVVKPSKKVLPNDVIVCKLMKYPPIKLIPQDIPLEILYEDDDLLVVNKPWGMCSHPGVGNRDQTLVNALLYHLGAREVIEFELDDEDEDFEPNFNDGVSYASDAIRPGIVHRLDKDTSGLLVVSKKDDAMRKLQSQFVDRSISRYYYTIVWGKLKEKSGTFEGNIGRSPRDRKKFAVLKNDGKNAITDYEVLEEYSIASLVKVKLRTGRTHQIRVHFSHFGHPVLGDVYYGGDRLILGQHSKFKKSLGEKCLSFAKRQILHAKEITFIHPTTKETITIISELPTDFNNILEVLRGSEEGK